MKDDSPATASAGYRALTESVALLQAERAVFHLHGAQAERVVNGLVTNSIDGVADGRGVYAFALTAKGRPITDMRVLPGPAMDGAESLWLDVPAAGAEGFSALLTRSVPPIFAFTDRVPVARISIVGPEAASVWPSLSDSLGASVSDLPEDPLGTLSVPVALPAAEETDEFADTALLVRRETAEGPGFDAYLPESRVDFARSRLLEAVSEAGGTEAMVADWEIVRVERGIPVYGADITTDNLVQETLQTDRAVSFEKGCYTGQEVVARLHYRGHVNRELRGLALAPNTRSDTGPSSENDGWFEPGLELESDGRAVGLVTSVVTSPRHGGIGLGYVRTSIEAGGVVSAGANRDIVVLELPFT